MIRIVIAILFVSLVICFVLPGAVAEDFLIFVFLLGAGLVACVVVLNFVLTRRQEEDEEEAETRVFGQIEKEQAFDNIEDYAKARRLRWRRSAKN